MENEKMILDSNFVDYATIHTHADVIRVGSQSPLNQINWKLGFNKKNEKRK